MRITDYGKIAPVYDANRERTRIAKDATLAEYLASHSHPPFRVLDLACGTGSWLEKQTEQFSKSEIRWYGLDGSAEMLAVAKGKLSGVDLTVAKAEQLPYEDTSLDYISCRFAFHHFQSKNAALDEVARVLRTGGILNIVNILPELMQEWWVYQFFPETLREDRDRFWSHKKLHAELSRRGFDVKIDANYRLRQRPLSQLLVDTERRDISELSNLDDETYQQGLERMRGQPSAEQTVLFEFTTLACIATNTGEPGITPQPLSV